MIVTCPKCKKRFILDDSKAQSKGIRLKCNACGTGFGLDAEDGGTKGIATPLSCPVLLATDDQETRGIVEQVLKGESIGVLKTGNGEETIDAVEKRRPRIVILDVALPGLYSFAICEKIKNNPGLKETRVILYSAAFNEKRYRRKPSTLFGADDYIEKHDIRSELISKIQRLASLEELRVKLPETANPAKQASGGAAQPPPAENGTGKGHKAANTGAQNSAEVHDRAKKLARVIAADIILYHRKKIDVSSDGGNIYELFKNELEEGLKYFKKRLPHADCAETYLKEALEKFVIESAAKECAH